MYFRLAKLMIYYHLSPSTLLRSASPFNSQNHSPKGQGARLSHCYRHTAESPLLLPTPCVVLSHMLVTLRPMLLGQLPLPLCTSGHFPTDQSAVNIRKVYVLLFLQVCSVLCLCWYADFPGLAALESSCKGISSGNKVPLSRGHTGFLER